MKQKSLHTGPDAVKFSLKCYILMHAYINNEYNTHLCTKVKGKLSSDPVFEEFCSNSFMWTESNIFIY